MAKIKTTAIVDAISGKVNGTVFSRNRGGAYMRSKGVTKFKSGSELGDSVNALGVTTVQSGSPQGEVIALLVSFSKKWQNLPADSRIAFNASVDRFQRSDVFGDMKTPTGAQVYTRLNVISSTLAAKRKVKTNALDEITQPPFAPYLPAITQAGFSITAGDSTALPAVDTNITLFAGAPVDFVQGLNEFVAILVEATVPMSAGISKVNDSDFRQIWVDNSTIHSTGSMGSGYALADTDQSFTAAYQERFGAIDGGLNNSIRGKKVFIRLTFVSPITGFKAQSQVFSSLID